MKISFVSIEHGITALGFRKMASWVRSIHPETEVCHIAISNMYSPIQFLLTSGSPTADLPDISQEQIAMHLVKSDIICFSTMTSLAKLTKKIIHKIRRIDPNKYIIWGGIHPMVDPEDAIKHSDAICTAEGEFAFQEFLTHYKNNTDFTKTKNFWFNVDGRIIRNGFRTLKTSEEMEKLPFPLYAENELIYKHKNGFVPMEDSDYLSFLGLTYVTIWSIGCPYRCIYCINSMLIENDNDYKKLRYTSPDYLISEIKNVIQKHPHISFIDFEDDGFMALPYNVLEEFAVKWKEEIKLPFAMGGANPANIQKRKMELLIWAGMNRFRMGIQSGSDRILEFYKRPNRPGLVQSSASIVGEYSNYIVPPAYDIILDNPIETKQDVVDTLDLLYNMPRPLNLNIVSLRLIPNTELSREFAKLNIHAKDISTGIFDIVPSIGNIMVYVLAIVKPPKKIFNFVRNRAKPYSEKQTMHPIILFIVQIIWLANRGIGHLRFMDFSIIKGKTGYVFWKLGILKFWLKHFSNKLNYEPPKQIQKENTPE